MLFVKRLLPLVLIAWYLASAKMVGASSSGSGPSSSSAATTITASLTTTFGEPIRGTKKVAVILLRYNDGDFFNPTIARTRLRKTLNGVGDYFETLSLNALNLNFAVLGPVTVPSDGSRCSTFEEERAALASAMEDSADSFDFVVSAVEKSEGCKAPIGGDGSIGGKSSRVFLDFADPERRANTFRHELLHNLGLAHARIRCVGTFASDPRCTSEYSDPLDQMGRGKTSIGAWARSVFGWLPQGAVVDLSSPEQSGVYELAPLGIDGRAVQAIRIRTNVALPRDNGIHDAADPRYDYWISFRQPIGLDAAVDTESLMHGAQIHLNPRTPRSFSRSRPAWPFSYLVQAGHPSEDDALGTTLRPEMTFTDDAAGVRIKVLEISREIAGVENSRLKVQVCFRSESCPVL